jgi:hypothetical protein
MYDFWGNEFKRFFKLETLASATDHLLAGADRFILPSVQSVLGEWPITSLRFDLFQEGRYMLIFKLQAVNAKKKRADFAFVVSKNEQECSAVGVAEHGHLRTLFERAPQFVVKPYRGGTIFLLDRHGRHDQGREIYAYLTQWLETYDEMGVDKNLQFITNVEKRHTFTRKETEQIKGVIAEVIFRVYDPKRRESMVMPEIASGDFVINRGPRGAVKIKLITCRRMMQKTGPIKLIEHYLNTSWEWGGRRFYLAPDEPDTLYEGMARAVGADVARDWLGQYASAAALGKARCYGPEYLEALRATLETHAAAKTRLTRTGGPAA